MPKDSCLGGTAIGGIVRLPHGEMMPLVEAFANQISCRVDSRKLSDECLAEIRSELTPDFRDGGPSRFPWARSLQSQLTYRNPGFPDKSPAL